MKKQFTDNVKSSFFTKGIGVLFFMLIAVSITGCDDTSSRPVEDMFDSPLKDEFVMPSYDYDKVWDNISLEKQAYLRKEWRAIPEEKRPQWETFRNRVLLHWLVKRYGTNLPPAESGEGEIVDRDMPFIIEELYEALYLGDELLDGEPQDGGIGYGPYDGSMKENGESEADNAPAVPLSNSQAEAPDTTEKDGIDMEEWQLGK